MKHQHKIIIRQSDTSPPPSEHLTAIINTLANLGKMIIQPSMIQGEVVATICGKYFSNDIERTMEMGMGFDVEAQKIENEACYDCDCEYSFAAE